VAVSFRIARLLRLGERWWLRLSLAAFMALFLAVLLAAEAPGGARADWPTYGGAFNNQHFSELREINTSNVAGLAVAWTVAIPDAGPDAGDVSLETTPLVIRGREAGRSEIDALMFVTSPRGRVLALDGASGKVVWTAEPALRAPFKLCCSMSNRGVAFGRVGHGEPRVFVATADARLWAFSATDGAVATGFGDGEVPGVVTVGDNTQGFSLTMAPLFISRDEIPPDGTTGGRDLVIVGSSGGEFEARGSLTAFDALTGQQLWRFFTVPAPGEFGSETWPSAVPGPFADPYSRGGGGVWMTPAYEPESGRLFFSVGNPSPNLDGTHRTGNNLFTDSIVALDVRTGRHVWHYQQVHHDIWDYDPASPPLLFEVHGRRAVAEASKTGFFYILDRDSGVPLFACPETPVPASTFAGFDASPEITSPTQPVCPAGLRFVPIKEPGATVPDPGADVRVDSIFTPPSWNFRAIAPGVGGGSEWSPVAYHPGLDLAFISGVISPFLYVPFAELSPTPGSFSLGGLPIPILPPSGGTVTAIDTNTGTVRWQKKTRWPVVGGALATAGGVVFYGEGYPLVGSVVALSASTGIEMFRFWTAGGVNAAPMTYSANGRQFVTVAAGGAPHYLSRPGNQLITFAIKNAQ
jgi:quinohemoprotein ethanol dehydrogenase